MKLTQMKRLHNIKVGKFIIEFRDNSQCETFKVPTIKDTKPKKKAEPTVIKQDPKTDVEKVLEPEKVKEKEPMFKAGDPAETEAKIEKCYRDALVTLNVSRWDYGKQWAKCKADELTYQNCFYEEGEFRKECDKQVKLDTNIAYREMLDELYADTPEELARRQARKTKKREELKDTLKEAFEEVQNGNDN